MIGVSQPTVRRWASGGQIPGTRIGGQWRFWQPSVLHRVLGPAAAQQEAVALPDGFVEPRVLDVVSLGAVLGIHERTIGLLVRGGQLPARKTGGRWLAYWPTIRDHIAAGHPLGEQGGRR